MALSSEPAGMNEEELEWEGDMRMLNGMPYNGPAYLRYPDGALEFEATYVGGFREGECREWYPNGQLRRLVHTKRGQVQDMKEWHPDGAVKSVAKYEYGFRITYDEWDEAGKQVAQRRLDPRSPAAEYVRVMHERERNGTENGTGPISGVERGR